MYGLVPIITGSVKAGLAYFEKNIKSMEDDWSGVAIGYSQGGAVAAGVLRYCQEHNETSLRLKGAVCGDGPYDPLATLKRYIEMDKLYMPVAPSLLLKDYGDDGGFVMRAHCESGFLPYTKSNLKNNKGKERSFDLENGEAMNYCNFESVCNAWGVGSIAALTFQSNTTYHVGTGIAFYLRYCGGLVDEILDNEWSAREETIGGGLWAEQK